MSSMQSKNKSKVFNEPIHELAGYESITKGLSVQGSAMMLSGCIDSGKAHMIQALGADAFCRVIITYDEAKAREIVDDSRFFNRNTVFYPAKDLIFYSADIRSNELTAQRMKAIRAIIENEGDLTVVTTIDGCADMLMTREKLESGILTFEEGGIVDLAQLKKQLVLLGYENMGQVQAPGEFGVRGGIIDIFPLTDETPVRIELWDDEIDSIRSFDVESQRSIERLQKVTIYPATEYVLTQAEIDDGIAAINNEVAKQADIFKKSDKYEELSRLKAIPDNFNETTDIDKFVHSFVKDTVSLIEYFDRETTLFVLDEPNRIAERMELVEFEFTDSTKNRLEKGYIIPSQADMIFTCREIYAKVNCRRLLVVSTLEYKPKGLDIAEHFKVDSKSISSYNNRFEYLVADLKKYKKSGYRIVLISNSRTRAMRMVDDLRDNGIDSYFSEDYDKALVEGEIMVTYGNIHKGFEYPIVKFVVIAESDIFGQEKKDKKRRKKQYNGKAIADFNELAIGDYVVHENYGLGIYRGIEKIEVEGIERDYIKIEYSGTDTLYILATQLDVLQKYAGADARKPKLNKLNSQ